MTAQEFVDYSTLGYVAPLTYCIPFLKHCFHLCNWEMSILRHVCM